MPHASLLGSNGHHSTFTSEMISGQINVFIVLFKKKKKKKRKRKKRNTHVHTHNADTRRLLHTHTHTHTHACLHSYAHTAPRSKCNTTTRTGCLHILLWLSHRRFCADSRTTKRSAPSRGQSQTLSSPHRCIKALIRPPPPPPRLWIEKCFLQHDLLHPMIVSP